MEDTQSATVVGTGTGTGIGLTALGRLHLRVPEDGGYEEIVVERRWPDMQSARAWCERTIGRAKLGTSILEIQVFEESWHHARSWETTPNRPVAEALQLGVVGEEGAVRWSERRPMGPRPGSRHLF